MRFAPLSFGFAALTGLLFAPVGTALACSCADPGPSCQNTFQVDAVFTGSVLSITALPDDGPPLRPGEARMPRALRVELSIGEAFRGIQGSTVSLTTAGSGPACGYNFKQGERYLVYAYRAKDSDELVTGICTRTRPIADASEDLEFLQTLSSPTAGARLSGSVTHHERNLTGEPAQDYGAVPNLLVTARSGAVVSTARTDAQGRYEMTVPPGRYEVALESLQGFSTNGLNRTVELRDARACSMANFGVHFNGRIKGVVYLASGDPGTGVLVEAIAAERVGGKGLIETLRTTTGPGGAFEFREMPPGRYVVGVDLVRRMDPGTTFPTTFHPGTPDPALATIVHLEGGYQLDLDPMTLPLARRSFQLTGTVFFADGRPAPLARISLQDGTATWRQVAMGTNTTMDGAFTFVVHEGLSYNVSASYWDEAERRQVRATVGPIVVTGDIGPVKVVLSGK